MIVMNVLSYFYLCFNISRGFFPCWQMPYADYWMGMKNQHMECPHL